jgi:hypothetical protein
MIVFSSQDSARFRFRADFSEYSFANISFFNARRDRILFHLSLRPLDGVVVCNNRGRGKHDWGREITKVVPIASEGCTVEVRFDLPHVTVLLDATPILKFGARLKRHPFPDLREISLVDFQGGISAATLDMDTAASRTGPLQLTSRLELRGQLPGPLPTTPLRLEFDDVPDAPSLIVIPSGTSGTSLRAVLPGRFWQGLPNGAERRIRLCADSIVLAEFALKHSDLLKHINAALALGDLGGDMFLATQILEHVKFAQIADELDKQARANLAGLTDFLRLDSSSLSDTATPLPLTTLGMWTAGPDIAAEGMTRALAEVACALHEAGTDDLEGVIDALSPPSGCDVPLFYAALAEPFCYRNAFDRLYAHVAQSLDISTHFTARDHVWYNSGLLPYLLRSGRLAVLHEILEELVGETDAWFMTPPLAWTIQNALEDTEMAHHDRDRILQAFLAFLAHRRNDYWQRTPCTQLIETGVKLIDAAHRMSQTQRDKVEIELLRSFGLMPVFWDCIATHQPTLPPQLAAAAVAFVQLRDVDASLDDRAAALRLFEHAGCDSTIRFRRDLFGPAGLPGPKAPTPHALMQEGLDLFEPALRHLAAPSTIPGLESRSLQNAACAALPACYPSVPRAPQYYLQGSASRRAGKLLELARAGTDPLAACAELLPDLVALTHAESSWIGVGIALGLLGGLIRAGANKSADMLLSAIDQALNRANMGRSERGSLLHNAAIAMPLQTLVTLIGRDRANLVMETLAILPPPSSLEPDAPPALAGADRTNPIFDTLVVVFSCQVHLETRIPQIRASWLSQLSTLQVPYIIVTGGGTGQIEGDVLALNAPDDYEGLPQKILASIDWVLENTSFTHMLKIDDDCFLNAPEYFHSLSYRKFDYYGRPLTRAVGQMDRAWHCAKSTSPRGCLEYDKSPEPSTYCDGGSGYALSRRAMAAVREAAASPQGRSLTQVSFMEDKLLGDLLALRGIYPENEDYRITVRRRETPQGRPIPRWVNSFYASRTAPVKVVHLDSANAQHAAQMQLTKSGLWPKKIWPSYQNARLGEQTNALEMITGDDRIATARDAPVAVVAVMRNEMFMLPHFLAHYRRLGVESFLIADNCSDDGTMEFLESQPDVLLFSVDTDYRHSHYGVAWQQAMMAHFRTGRWSLVADADELLTWQAPQRQTLPDLLRGRDFRTADAVRTFMLDMYPEGRLEKADFTSGDPFTEAGFTDRVPFLHNSYGRGPYSDSPTWTSTVRHRLIAGSRNDLFVAQKVALLKYSPFLRLSAGLHYVAGAQLAQRELLFGHFKYNADFHRKAKTEVSRRQHFNNAEEYRKYLSLISEGREVIYDPAVSVSWTDCDFVRARLA